MERGASGEIFERAVVSGRNLVSRNVAAAFEDAGFEAGDVGLGVFEIRIERDAGKGQCVFVKTQFGKLTEMLVFGVRVEAEKSGLVA